MKSDLISWLNFSASPLEGKQTVVRIWTLSLRRFSYNWSFVSDFGFNMDFVKQY